MNLGNMNNGRLEMSSENIARYELAQHYELGSYYNEFCGNIIIPAIDVRDERDIQEILFVFLRTNPDWIMGYEESYKGCPIDECCYYLQTSEDFKNW